MRSSEWGVRNAERGLGNADLASPWGYAGTGWGILTANRLHSPSSAGSGWTPMDANIWRGGIGLDHEAHDFELIKSRFRGTLIRAHSCSFAVLSSRPEGERK